MASPRRVVLVGFMGSGKSAVAPALAALLGWEHLDMDVEIERTTGLAVAEIFRQKGEAAFREEEKALALRLAPRERLVVAAGGGAFAQPDTREALRRGAAAVWLRCDLETVMERIPRDGSRPLAGSRETIAALFAAREPSYRLADWTFDAARLPPEAVARAIADAVFPGRPAGARRTSER
ncbi:MAG TPA: shikimate kinase [Vicinamibacteria bacterium]|nr:shikimate kinase [Vicinamibacteria bacterium]